MAWLARRRSCRRSAAVNTAGGGGLGRGSRAVGVEREVDGRRSSSSGHLALDHGAADRARPGAVPSAEFFKLPFISRSPGAGVRFTPGSYGARSRRNRQTSPDAPFGGLLMRSTTPRRTSLRPAPACSPPAGLIAAGCGSSSKTTTPTTAGDGAATTTGSATTAGGATVPGGTLNGSGSTFQLSLRPGRHPGVRPGQLRSHHQLRRRRVRQGPDRPPRQSGRLRRQRPLPSNRHGLLRRPAVLPDGRRTRSPCPTTCPSVSQADAVGGHHRQDLHRQDHQLERPGHRRRQPRRDPAQPAITPVAPLGRLGHDQQLHPVPVEGGARRTGRSATASTVNWPGGQAASATRAWPPSSSDQTARSATSTTPTAKATGLHFASSQEQGRPGMAPTLAGAVGRGWRRRPSTPT